MSFFEQIQDEMFMTVLVETIVTLLILGTTTLWAKIFFKPEEQEQQTFLKKMLFYLKLLAFGSVVFLSIVVYWVWDDLKGDVRGYIVENAKSMLINNDSPSKAQASPSPKIITPDQTLLPTKKTKIVAEKKIEQEIEQELKTEDQNKPNTEPQKATLINTPPSASEDASQNIPAPEPAQTSAQTSGPTKHKISLMTSSIPQNPLNTLRKRLRKNALVKVEQYLKKHDLKEHKNLLVGKEVCKGKGKSRRCSAKVTAVGF